MAAGIRCEGGKLWVFDSTVSGNKCAVPTGTASYGGGIYTTSTTHIRNSTISNNLAGDGSVSDSSGFGGGIYITSSNAQISNSTISNNFAGGSSDSSSIGFGGGIYAMSATICVTNSNVSGNTITQGNGGGIYSTGSLVVSGSTISNNRSTSGVWGDGICSTLGILQVTDSVICGNYGDGIDIYRSTSNPAPGPCYITNSVFSGNRDDGIDITLRSGGTAVITNATVVGNGSGIVCSVPLALANSIVAFELGFRNSQPHSREQQQPDQR